MQLFSIKNVLILAFFLILHTFLFACDCEIASPTKAKENATFVFSGKVIEINGNWMSGGMKIGFLVAKSWKKECPQYIIINTPFHRNCGLDFEMNKEYLVYVNKKYNTPKTDTCSGTRVLADANEYLATLGEGIAPSEKAPNLGSFPYIVGGLAVFSVLFVGFVVLRKRKK